MTPDECAACTAGPDNPPDLVVDGLHITLSGRLCEFHRGVWALATHATGGMIMAALELRPDDGPGPFSEAGLPSEDDIRRAPL